MSSTSANQRAAVIFDLDGVLLDSEELHFRAYNEVLAEFGVQVGKKEYAEHWIGAGHGPEYAVAQYALPITASELRARKAPKYRRWLESGARLMPGARATVERLYGDFLLGIATNSSQRDVRWVLERLDLQRYFAAVVTREDYARAKPAPDAYVKVRADLGVAPAQCLVVEDSPRGVLAARAAALAVVAVPNEFTRLCAFPPATEIVEKLERITPEFVRAHLGPAGTESILA
ncbi:MAG: haloacid dehalogenase [Candidatus Binatia bacterium]|nr:MAG: haloacid dehalogenase [Candidatus Binatia bacterium]